MKLLLVAPPIMDYRDGNLEGGPLKPIAMDSVRECPPYGIYMLASAVRAAGHSVVLADLIARGTHRVTAWRDDLADCDLVGIGATSMSWPTARVLIDQVRRVRKDVPIVLGGIHPTMFDYYLLRTFPVQFIVRGEAEAALPMLCDVIDGRGELASVPNLSWRTPDGRFVRNAITSKIPREHLGHFPLPDYDELPSGVYKGLAIESSRGCAFDCSFCSTSYRRSWRGIPPNVFVDRLEHILPQLPRTLFRTVHIIDDEFSMNPKRATAIACLIRDRGLHPMLVFDSRATDLLYEGYVENIAEFTCQFLVGAECGYDEGLERIGKGTTCDVLERAAAKLQQFGISDRADFSFILGLPWETRHEVEKTIRFAMRLHAIYGVRVLLQWYCQIPGSRLWEDDRNAGIVNETMYNNFGFFRDLHMFRSGVRLTPDEVWAVGDIVEQLKFMASLRSPDRRMVEFAFPLSIYDFYPRDVIAAAPGTGLASLREVARPSAERSATRKLIPVSDGNGDELDGMPVRFPSQIGIPQRHFVGHQ